MSAQSIQDRGLKKIIMEELQQGTDALIDLGYKVGALKPRKNILSRTQT